MDGGVFYSLILAIVFVATMVFLNYLFGVLNTLAVFMEAVTKTNFPQVNLSGVTAAIYVASAVLVIFIITALINSIRGER